MLCGINYLVALLTSQRVSQVTTSQINEDLTINSETQVITSDRVPEWRHADQSNDSVDYAHLLNRSQPAIQPHTHADTQTVRERNRPAERLQQQAVTQTYSTYTVRPRVAVFSIVAIVLTTVCILVYFNHINHWRHLGLVCGWKVRYRCIVLAGV